MCMMSSISAATAATISAISSAASATASAATAAAAAVGSGIAAAGSTVGGLAASGITALGASAGVAGATGTVVSGMTVGLIKGAALGAAMGAGGAAITGRSVGKGALRGLAIGSLTGGLLGGIGSIGDAAATAKSITNSGNLLQAAESVDQMGNQGVEVAQLMQEAGQSGNLKAAVEVADTAQKGGLTLTNAEKIALGVGLASAAATGISQVEQAKEEAKALERQAAAEDARAQTELESGRREAIDVARKSKQEQGAGIAQLAANGVMVDDAREGAVPTMYEGDMAAELAYDQAKIMQNANLRAWGYRSNAAELRSSARTRRRAGYVSAGLGAFNAGVSAYGGTKTLLS